MTGVRLRDEAIDDILTAVAWYEKQRQDLGVEFTVELELAFERIAEGPEMYSTLYRGVRRALLRRFPYAIYFVLMDEVAHVLAVLHQRQSPEEWWIRRGQ